MVAPTLIRELAAAPAAGLKFLLIGGHAVALSGYRRYTHDVDLMIQRDDLQRWRPLMERAEYRFDADFGSFTRFLPANGAGWPVDLMLVNEGTFGKMWTASAEETWLGVSVRIPSPAHLVALKLHALRNAGDRRSHDLIDILELAAMIPEPSRWQTLDELCSQYGTPKIHELLRHRFGPDAGS